MEIINRGNVFIGKKGTNYQSCTFPSICILPGGRWVCGFRAAPIKQSTKWQESLITWSDDEGSSWTEPISPFKETPTLEGRSGLFRSIFLTTMGKGRLLAALYWVDNSNPELPFFNEETEGLLDSKIFLTKSVDGGKTWSQPELMDTSPFDVPTPLTGPVLKLPNGELACQFELNKHYYDQDEWCHSAVLMFSKDGGKTWPEYSLPGDDPANRIFYWDQRPSIMDDGKILDLFWTYDTKNNDYLNIHARESNDNGRTWSEFWDTRVPGQPGQPVSLSEEKIAMSYVDRTDSPVIKVRSSNDGGRTWPESSEIIVFEAEIGSQIEKKGSMQDAWSEMGAYSIGHPATIRLNQDEFLVVFYAGDYMDQTDIKWVHLRV